MTIFFISDLKINVVHFPGFVVVVSTILVVAVQSCLFSEEIPIQQCEKYKYRNCKAVKAFQKAVLEQKLTAWNLMLGTAAATFDIDHENSVLYLDFPFLLEVTNPLRIKGTYGDSKANLPDVRDLAADQIDLTLTLNTHLETDRASRENMLVAAQLAGPLGHSQIELKIVPECGIETGDNYVCDPSQLTAIVRGYLYTGISNLFGNIWGEPIFMRIITENRLVDGFFSPRAARHIELTVLEKGERLVGDAGIYQAIEPRENVKLKKKPNTGIRKIYTGSYQRHP